MAKNRSLKAVIRRLGQIDQKIQQIIDKKGHANVLEVGCGFGLPMLELKKKFRNQITLTGINRDEKFNLPKKALWEGIKQMRFLPWDWITYEKRFGFPTYVNCDASLKLPFEGNSFDFVYSIATTFFLHDKIHFLEELNRILKPECEASVHFSHSAIEHGLYPEAPDAPYDNLCEIQNKDGTVVSVEKYFKKFACISLIDQENGKPTYLRLRKTSDEIDLGLTLVDSCWLPDINSKWIGYARGVYCLTHDEPRHN